MNEVLQQLHNLTEVDFSIAQTREQLARYPAMLDKMAAAEAKQQKTIAEAEAQLDAARHERRKAEKEVQTLQDQIKKYVSQQSAVKTNKEYQAITHEIDQLRVKIDTWETIGLEKLEIEDECLGRKKAAATQLAALEAEHATERRRIEEQMMEKQERIERLTAERQRRFDAIPEEWKELYELLNTRHPGTACVPLEGENCGGCHWTLVPQTRQLVRVGEELVRCEHCRRFLYAKE